MNDFFEKAYAIKQRYYQDAIALEMSSFPFPFNPKTFNPSEDGRIEILSELIATYFMYDGDIPNNFSIKLSRLCDTDWLLAMLQTMFNDLAIPHKIDSIFRRDTFLKMYNSRPDGYAYIYDIKLLK